MINKTSNMDSENIMRILIKENESLKITIEELKNDISINKTQIQELINFNMNFPIDINKHFKLMKNEIDDVRDHLERIEYEVDKKTSSKNVVNNMKIRINHLEKLADINQSKYLDLQDTITGIDKKLYNITQTKISTPKVLIDKEYNTNIDDLKIQIAHLTNPDI